MALATNLIRPMVHRHPRSQHWQAYGAQAP